MTYTVCLRQVGNRISGVIAEKADDVYGDVNTEPLYDPLSDFGDKNGE